MSSPHYDWRVNVDLMVRNYPHRITEAAELGQKMPPAKLREYESVTEAISSIRGKPDGTGKLQLIQDMYWDGPKKKPLGEAATAQGLADQKAKQWRKAFLLIVAANFGYLFPR